MRIAGSRLFQAEGRALPEPLFEEGKEDHWGQELGTEAGGVRARSRRPCQGLDCILCVRGWEVLERVEPSNDTI